DCADIQTNRRADLFPLFLVETFLTQLIEHDVRAPFAPNHADVIRTRLSRGAQAIFILLVPTRDDGYGKSMAVAHGLTHGIYPIGGCSQRGVLLCWRKAQLTGDKLSAI